MRPASLALSASVLLAIMMLSANAFGGDEMLQAGDRFPQFELEAHDGSTVSSTALEGTPYLIYYYPKADTPGCTKEACAFRDSWPEVQSAGLKVLGVSYDTPEDNADFADKFNLQFPLLSDTDKELASQVGAQRALLPVPKRISYLVGADGTVLKAYPDVKPADHAGEVLADFEQLS